MRRLELGLVLRLSLLGLAMGLATVFVVPPNIEPLFWLVIFIVVAVIIGRRRVERPFLHGFATSLANSVWITGAHIAFFQTYLARHPDEAAAMTRMPLPDSPRLMMLMVGPVVGVASGLILGLFALVAARLLQRRAS